MDALRSYLKLICEYELHSLPNRKVSGAKDHGKNYIKVRLSLVRHLLRKRLLASKNLTVCCDVGLLTMELGLSLLHQEIGSLSKVKITRCDLSPRFFCIDATLLCEFESDKL